MHARLGRAAEARKQYALVEYIGRLSALNRAVYNRELALFYADHGRRLPEALELARRELQVRRDVYTYDVLAWALHQNGRAAEAAGSHGPGAAARHPRRAAALPRGDDPPGRWAIATARATTCGQALALNPRFHLLQADVAARDAGRAEARQRRPGRRP